MSTLRCWWKMDLQDGCSNLLLKVSVFLNIVSAYFVNHFSFRRNKTKQNTNKNKAIFFKRYNPTIVITQIFIHHCYKTFSLHQIHWLKQCHTTIVKYNNRCTLYDPKLLIVPRVITKTSCVKGCVSRAQSNWPRFDKFVLPF